MKTSITIKIAFGYIILLLTIFFTYIINNYIQNLSRIFEKDYNIYLNFSSKVDKLLQIQGSFFISFENTDYESLKLIIYDLNTSHLKLSNTTIYNQSIQVKNHVNTIQENIRIFIERYNKFLNNIQNINFSKIKKDDKELTPEELKLKKMIKDEIKQYISAREMILTGKTQSYANITEVIITELESIFKILYTEKEKLNSRRITITNILGFSGIIISIIASFFILFRLRKSLLNITGFVQNIANGDFTTTIEIKENDEIKLLSENIKKIISFQDILIQIKILTRTLENNYLKIKEIIEKFYDSINNQSASVDQTSFSFNELTRSLNVIALSSQTINSISIETKDKTRTSSLQIRDTITDIQVLANSATKIMNIVKIINDLTTQTELLSLNAAIEASKSGGSQKGFIVVSNEIRKLAETSSEATKYISKLARDIIIKIRLTARKSEISVEALQLIENKIEEVTNFIKEISEITEKESKDSIHIHDAVNMIMEQTKMNTHNADLIKENNLNLKNELEVLNKLVNKFRLSNL